MSNEHGPEYELPKGVSFENFDEFVFEDDLTVKREQDKTIKTNNTVKINKSDRKVKQAVVSKNKSNKKNKAAIIAVLASLLLIASVIVIVVNIDNIVPEIKNRDNVITITKDNLIIMFNGYDYAGIVNVTFDYEEILPQIYECMGVNPEAPGLAKEKQAELLFDEYYFEVVDAEDPEAGCAYNIYNGQKLKIIMKHVSWIEGETETDEDDITFRFEDTFIVCQGLEEPTEVDAFEDIQVVMYGEDGNLTAKCFYVGNNGSLWSHYFYIDGNKNGTFSYGDEITVCVDSDAIDRLYYNNGIILSRESCVYVAEQRHEYVVDLEEITDDNMSYMINEGINKVQSWAEKSPTKVSVGELEYFGAFLYSGSNYENIETGIYNKMVIVYTGKAYNDSEEELQSVDIYVPVIFEDIVNNTDGSQTVGSNISFRSNLHQDEELGTYICGYRDRLELLEAIRPYNRCLTTDYSEELRISDEE